MSHAETASRMINKDGLSEQEAAILNLIYKTSTLTRDTSIAADKIQTKDLWYAFYGVNVDDQNEVNQGLNNLVQSGYLRVHPTQNDINEYQTTPKGDAKNFKIIQQKEAQALSEWAASITCAEIRKHIYRETTPALSEKTESNDYPQYDLITGEQAKQLVTELKTAQQATKGFGRMRVMDVACGAGGVTGKLSENPAFADFDFLGFDQDAKLIEHASDKFKAHENVNFLNYSDADFVKNQDEFDNISVAFLADALYFMPEDASLRLLDCIFNKLHPGGKLIIFHGARPKIQADDIQQAKLSEHHEKSGLSTLVTHFNMLKNATTAVTHYPYWEFWKDAGTACEKSGFCLDQNLKNLPEDTDLATRKFIFETKQALAQNSANPNAPSGRWCLVITKVST